MNTDHSNYMTFAAKVATARTKKAKNAEKHTDKRAKAILKQALASIAPDADGIDCREIASNPELDMLVEIAVDITLDAAARDIGYMPDECDAIAYAYSHGISVMAMDQDGDHVLSFECVSAATLDRAMVRRGILTPKYSDKPFHKAMAEHPGWFTECQRNLDGTYSLTSKQGNSYSYNPTTTQLEWLTKSGKSSTYVKPRLFDRYFSFLDAPPKEPYVKKERTPKPKKEKPAPPKKTHEQIALQRTKFFTDKLHDPECERLDPSIDEQTMSIRVTATGSDGRTAIMHHTHEELDIPQPIWNKTAWLMIRENRNPITYA